MAKDITKTPIKLYPAIARVIAAKFRQLIEDHGLTFAVNAALANHLRSLGASVAVVETPTDRMKNAQKRRWRKVHKAESAADVLAEQKREARRARDKARKAEQSASLEIEGEAVGVNLI